MKRSAHIKWLSCINTTAFRLLRDKRGNKILCKKNCLKRREMSICEKAGHYVKKGKYFQTALTLLMDSASVSLHNPFQLARMRAERGLCLPFVNRRPSLPSYLIGNFSCKEKTNNGAKRWVCEISAKQIHCEDCFITFSYTKKIREHIIIEEISNVHTLINFHILDLPESEKNSFGIMSVESTTRKRSELEG